jgi:hypothetical protein
MLRGALKPQIIAQFANDTLLTIKGEEPFI